MGHRRNWPPTYSVTCSIFRCWRRRRRRPTGFASFQRETGDWWRPCAGWCWFLIAGTAISVYQAVRARNAQRVALLQRDRADTEAATAAAVNDFLQNDLLSQAGADQQQGGATAPDPDVKVRTLVDRAAAAVSKKLKGKPMVEADLRRTLGETYLSLGLLKEAESQLQQSYDLNMRTRGPNAVKTIESLQALGTVEFNNGQYAESAKHQGLALEAAQKVLGPNAPLTLQTMQSVAVNYTMLGQPAKAEPLLKKVLDLQIRRAGYDNAETLDTSDSLAFLYIGDGRYAEAQALLERGLQSYRKVYGPDHPNTQRELFGLARVLTNAGEYAKAEELASGVYQSNVRLLGASHFKTISAERYLARIDEAQGKLDEAEKLASDALRKTLANVGERNVDALSAKEVLASIYEKRNDFPKAQKLLEDVERQVDQVYGATNPESMIARQLLGSNLLHQKQCGPAARYLEAAHQRWQKDGSANWRRFEAQALLGEALACQKDFGAAEPLLLSGYQGLKESERKMPANQRGKVKTAAAQLAALYGAWNKPEPERQWRTVSEARNETDVTAAAMQADTQATCASLIIDSPGVASRVFSLQEACYRLGRSSTNELPFPADARLSREHLLFERNDDDGWTVKDLGSQNGTQINGVSTKEEIRLSHGDRIAAGQLTIRFDHRVEHGGVNLSRITFVAQNAANAKPTISVDLQAALEANSETGSRRKSHLRALMRAGRELAGLGVLDKLFEVVLDLSLGTVNASRGVVMTANGGSDLQVRAVRGEGFEISTAVRDLVMKQARSVLVRDALWDRDLAERPSIVTQQVRSILAVPLQTDESVIGLLYVDSPHVVREFTAEDLNLVTVIANIAAIRMEHARLLEKEQARKLLDQDLARAVEIQRRLLPSDAPSIGGFDFAGYNAPCRLVGGDYYDFLPYPDGRVAVLIGDVSGKGLGAALLMSSLQARSQVIFGEKGSLAEEVSRLNKSMSASCPGNSFVTFFVAVLDPATGEITYCNAGHNAPMLLRDGDGMELLEATGMPLGIVAGASYEQKTCRMEAGDALVLFSDGVTEAYGADPDDEFGEERLVSVLRRVGKQSAAGAIEAVKSELFSFTGGVAADDVTLVIARRTVDA